MKELVEILEAKDAKEATASRRRRRPLMMDSVETFFLAFILGMWTLTVTDWGYLEQK